MVGAIRSVLALMVVGVVTTPANAPEAGDAHKEHREVIRSSGQRYTVTMGGKVDGPMTRDPIGYGGWRQTFEPNVEVVMTNHGPAVARNPWLIINGRGHCRTLREVVDHVVKPGMSEAEKARALWEWHRRHRFHSSTGTPESSNAIKVYNVYGYTLCGNDSVVVADLWRTAKLKVRSGKPQGHSTTEVFYDGRWHLLDGDENIICLHPDNKAIASEDEIIRDHELMKLTHTYGILRADSRPGDEVSAALHCHQDRKHGKKPSGGEHSMTFDLRPGESMIWRWSNVHKWYGGDQYGSWKRVGDRVANGQLVYAPSFARDCDRRLVGRIANGRFDGAAGRPVRLVPDDRGKPMQLTVRMQSPYVIVGGRIEAGLRRKGAAAIAGIDVSFDRKIWQRVWKAEGVGDSHVGVDIDKHFPRTGPARYQVWLRFELWAGDGAEGVALHGFKIALDLQMAPLTLPALTLGQNRVMYTDETAEPHVVHVIHRWIERTAWQRPDAPKLVFPRDGDRAVSTRPHFRWERPKHTDGVEIADYQFQLAEHEDMRWVLSPNFDKLIGRTAYRGQIPKKLADGYEPPYDGLLNAGQSYYWRIRARDARGVWGSWSEVARFVPKGPGVPVALKATVNRDERSVVIHWKPNPNGNKPAHYEVYGSDERGFSPSREPYDVVTGNNTSKRFSANLIARTRDTRLGVVGPDLGSEAFNKVYYRIVAVDAKGVRSRATTSCEVPHPMFVSSLRSKAQVGHCYEYAPRTTRSIGHLVGYTANNTPYTFGFRWGDELTFSLSQGPAWLKLDAKTGRLSGTPPTSAKGTSKVSLHVVSKLGGRDQQQFEICVTP